MNTIGPDCQNIIMTYKQQLEKEEHKLKFKKSITIIDHITKYVFLHNNEYNIRWLIESYCVYINDFFYKQMIICSECYGCKKKMSKKLYTHCTCI